MIELAHVVFYVRDLQQSLHFYQDMLQLQLKGRIFNNRAAVLTGGRSHHELLLIESDASEGPLTGHRIGLYHVGWKIGEDLEQLRAMQQRIEDFGYRIDGTSDHGISKSLYLRDPDGNEVELFVDDPEFDWQQDDSWMQAPVRPLKL